MHVNKTKTFIWPVN